MKADFTPEQSNYTNMGQFRFWCQKVLPLVYDDSLSYYELLCKVVNYLNDTITNVDAMGEATDNLYNAYMQLQEYVNIYFDNLSVQGEVNNKLNDMAIDGTLTELLEPYMGEYITTVANLTNQTANMQTQLSNLVLHAGNPESSSAEIVQARDGFATLYDKIFTLFQGNTTLIKDTTLIADVNNVLPNRCYAFDTNSGVANLPSSKQGTLVTFGIRFDNYATSGQMQIFRERFGRIYHRLGWSSGYSEWESPVPNDYLLHGFGIPTLNNTSIIEDANTMPPNKVYSIGVGSGIANLPNATQHMTIINIGGLPENSSYKHAGQVQLAIDTKGRMYYRIHWNAGDFVEPWNEVLTNTNVPETTVYPYPDDSYLGLLDFTAVGDSLTVGLSYPDGSPYAVGSWAKVMALKMGVECAVYARGGRNTKEFIDSEHYSLAIGEYRQFAVMFFGVNDVIEEMPLGSVDDIGSNNNTFYANYSKIIRDLLVNHKFVFCLNIPRAFLNRDARTEFNRAIADICSYYDKAFMCDVARYNDTFKVYSNGHLSSVGYACFARCVATAICDTMRANSYFYGDIDVDTYGPND